MSGISYGLEEKVVVVTGGSRGIGLELARNFLAAGGEGRHLRPESRRISRPPWKSSAAASGSTPCRPMSPARGMWRTSSTRPSADSGASISSSTTSG